MEKTFKKLILFVGLLFVLLLPGLAVASVDTVTNWPARPTIVSDSGAMTVNGKFTVGAGSNRLLLVAVATRFGAATNPTITVTYGGQAVTATAVNATANTSKIWLGYLNEAGILAAGSNKTLTVTCGTAPTALYATAAVYAGVNQTTPITGSGSNVTAGAATLAVSAAYNVTGINGNNGLSVFATNFIGVNDPLTVYTGYTKVRDFVNSTTNNINLANGIKAIVTGTETPSVSVGTAVAGAIAAVGINPVTNSGTNYSTITTCGDCHGNPPSDTTVALGRGVPAGMFLGSHDKHSGGNDYQYGMACTVCHRNNTTMKHSNGRINVAGSSLPGTAYSNTSSIAIRNNPTLGTCSNIACHSTGRSTVQYTSPSWGSTTVTCLSCHGGRAAGNGPAAKSTSGFGLSTTHSQHLKLPYTAAQINCNMCHSRVVTDAQTLKQYSGVVKHNDGIKTVNFSDLNYGSYTSYKTSGANNGKCSNVSCHGGITRNAWSNAGAVNNTNACTHCHGQPQAANISTGNTNLKMYAPGWVNGAYTGTSTDQLTADSDPRVGAHFAHLSSVYSKQIKCNECHRIPASPFDAGGTHMLGPRYNSQTVTFLQASTATKNGVFTSYTAGTATKAVTCSTTYCHGSKFIQGDTAGSGRKPTWVQNTLIARTPDATTCGRCHGNPPNSVAGSHAGATPTTSCAGCHSATVNASGQIINKTLHINGINDVAMLCNNCHDYDTTGGGTTWGKTNYGGTPGLEGRGAHAKHIEYLKTRYGITLNAATDAYGGAAFNAVCGVCHSQNSANHTPANAAGTRSVDFNGSTARQFGGSAPVYNGLYNTSSGANPKSCSNTDCHYRTSPVWSTY